ncbi:sodium-dependent bicarbonate transport family permease [Candidatus Nitrosotenuis sp. DW1]|uniref:sodium-dependent bicarbonate transport family permease n=1 Tax=Candidatus Nitrosotenuis sp. DW1 TaxID=2259672 RepID=UPI0015C95B49|nr:sodium-dependent bicarbonate transport family permease [Candidatus Nitrosotenuis sp. DW1]QLH09096.1 sodium-dependent bicarbonate transport family permease [Candidatus Nitrosotenuis sp. DW1]
MNIFEIIQSNLLTPLVLFFILGIVAARVKSDLRIPEEVSSMLSIYLLAAIGLHGGIEMKKIGLENIIIPISAAIGLSIVMTLNHYQILQRLGKFSIFDSYAIAATYGSVGATSFSVGLAFLKTHNVQSEGFMAAILAVLEPVSLILCIFLVNISASKIQRKTESYETKDIVEKIQRQSPNERPTAIEIGGIRHQTSLRQVLYDTISGKAIVILLGAITIGYIIGEQGFQSIKIGFEDMFFAALVIFLIEMGIIAGQKLEDIRKAGIFLIAFAILVPTLNGVIGVIVSTYLGLSIGGAVMFGLLLASASFIAAPSVLRTAIKKANPGLYITSALGITFPFNIIILLPMMFILSTMLHSGMMDFFG